MAANAANVTNSEFNKRTAILYVSAAVLILAVGVRMLNSIMSESDAFGTFEYIMIGAIVLEVFVLIYYADLIRKMPDDTAAAGPVNLAANDAVGKQFLEFKQGLEVVGKEIRESRAQLAHANTVNQEYFAQLQKHEAALLAATKKLIELQSHIEALSENKLRESIRSEVQDILTAISVETRKRRTSR